MQKKCDRCGKFYEYYDGVGANGLRYRKIQLIGDNAPIFDLCEDCMKSLFDWLDLEKKKGAEQ